MREEVAGAIMSVDVRVHCVDWATALTLALQHLFTREVGVWKHLEILTHTEPVIRLDVGRYLASGARETALVTRYYYVGADGRATFTTVAHG